MLISLRKKQVNRNIHNNTMITQPSNDDSFGDSNVSKRFTRKKNTSNEHNRTLKTSKITSENNDNKSITHQQKKICKISSSYIKAQELFIRIGHTTPTKDKKYYTPISSDRATQTTYQKSRYQTEFTPIHHIQQNKNNINQLREELQLRNSQLMLLEDQVMRLKREIIIKEEDFMKNNIKKEKQYQNQIKRLKDQIHILNQDIFEKNNQIKQYKKVQATFTRQIKSLKYDKLLLQKQIQQIYKKRLPKQLRQLISFRQISLSKQLQDLRLTLQQSKTQKQKQMQQQIRYLKEETNQNISNVKTLQVRNRIQNRKIIEFQCQVKEKTQNFNKCYLNMKDNNNDLLEQLKKSRKQNLKLRRLQMLTTPSKKKISICHSSSEQSLNFSLSSNN